MITSTIINPTLGFSVILWIEDGVMKMRVPGSPEAILFRPGDVALIEITGCDSRPVNVSTYRLLPNAEKRDV